MERLLVAGQLAAFRPVRGGRNSLQSYCATGMAACQRVDG